MEKGRILVIDDQLVICNLITDTLKGKGYSVDYRQNAIEGLKAVVKGKFDVVFLDLKLPDMNGIELLREIKLKEDPDAVVIIITGYASLESAQRALKIGAYDYITKPFNIDRIYFTARRAVAARKLIKNNKELLSKLQKKRNTLEKRVGERLREAKIVYRIGQQISSNIKLEEVLQNIVDTLAEELNLERCAILLLDDISGELSMKYAQGLHKQHMEQTKIKKGEKISGWVIGQNELIYSKDLNTDPRFAQRKQERYYTGSLISIPLVVRNKGIGVININNKKSGDKFTDSDLRLFREISAEISIGIENARLYQKLEEIYIRTIEALTLAVDAKDHYTKTHSEHVTKYAVAIAEEMELPLSQTKLIKNASRPHDVGKIGIHDYILTKPGKLTPDEWEEVKLYALKGAEILESVGLNKKATELIKQHHERYDGKGYPYGYKAEEIKLGARIIAVADAYDAMITKRPYRKAYSKEEAIKELERESGTQFDPQVIKAFLKVLKKEDKL